jgi:hypothetical protein
MATLVWDQVGERSFEAGVSKGVLYQENRVGIPWNGLTSIEEGSDTSVEPIYFDGTKFAEVITLGDFSGTMRALTYPDEFLFYEGAIQDHVGFYILNQPPSPFSLSYRTEIGDDVNGISSHYKLHLLYNLTAVPSQRSFQSIGDSLDPIEFEWSLTSVPEEIENFYPTSHVVFDSRMIDPYLLLDIEDILYGTAETDPYIPSLRALSTFVRGWNRFLITITGEGIWTAYARDDGVITMTDDTTFEIDTETATVIDADSYTITSEAKEEGDVWLP